MGFGFYLNSTFSGCCANQRKYAWRHEIFGLNANWSIGCSLADRGAPPAGRRRPEPVGGTPGTGCRPATPSGPRTPSESV